MPNALQVDMVAAGVVDTTGVPLAGGLIHTYSAGTTTDKFVYTDAAMTVAETNPVVLDGAGCKNVYAYGNYKFVVKTSAGVTVRTLDNQYYMVPSTSAEVVNSVSFADTPYTATAANQLIKVNTAGGAVTVVLPTSVGAEGIVITVVKTTADANAVTVDGDGAQTINGAATYVIANQYEGVQVQSDNANWFSVNANMSAVDPVTLAGTQTLTNKTLTAPVLGGTVTGTYTLGGTATITVAAWTNVTGGIGYNGNWADYSTNVVSFTKDPMGFIHMKGVAKKGAGAGDSLVLTLGADYRPATHTRYFYAGRIDSTALSTAIIIATNGQVTIENGGLEGDTVYFDSIPPFK